MSWKKSVLTFLLCMMTGCTMTQLSQQTENTSDSDIVSNEIEIAEVSDVVDGDTIKVYLNGKKYTIRMIGIDTPESVHPDKSKNTVYGQKASEYAKEMFFEGQTVYLSKDISDKDKYDRLLRYIWLEKPTDLNNETEIRQKMYNAKVLLDGYANAYEYAPDDTLYPLFLSFEAEAAEQERGLWAENGLSEENIKKVEEDQKTLESIEGEYAFIGNKNTKKLHSPLCSSLPKQENRVYFQSEEEALQQGYTIDKRCLD